MKRKILVADDEVYISEMLKDILIDLGYEVTDIVSTVETAVQSLVFQTPDLAILDIKMHGRNQGFEIARLLQEEYHIPFLFLTSFSDTSTVKEASELEPLAYLVKPFNEQNIFATLEVIFKKLDSTKDFIVIKDGTKHIKVFINDIVYVQSSDKYIELNTKNKKFLLRESLLGFSNTYKIPSMIQVHRSYLINKNLIQTVMRNVVIVNGVEIPVSRKYQDYLDSIFCG